MISIERSTAFGEQLKERRRRGRPRTAGPVIHTSVKVPEPLFDALCRRAQAKREPLHQMMLKALEALAVDFR